MPHHSINVQYTNFKENANFYYKCGLFIITGQIIYGDPSIGLHTLVAYVSPFEDPKNEWLWIFQEWCVMFAYIRRGYIIVVDRKWWSSYNIKINFCARRTRRRHWRKNRDFWVIFSQHFKNRDFFRQILRRAVRRAEC